MERAPASDRVAAPAAAPLRPESARRLARLPWRTYRLRTLGMGLAALPVTMVMVERGTAWPGWVWMVLSCLLWPHLAFLAATRSRDPFRAELRNFVVDSMLAGSWVPLMQFNLLPSAVLLTVVTADKISSGVRGLWLRSLPAMAVGLVLSALANGFAFVFPSSTAVVLSCLPIMTIHTLAVSASAYRLVRRVQRQNLQLEELARSDALTGLASHAWWHAEAEALLRRHQQQGQPAMLVMLDLDHFKQINDRYGHATGDDVLRAVGERIRHLLGAEDRAGRLGGDEFALALACGASGAQARAETLRVAVEALEFPRHPALRCSVSLGLAAPPDAGLGLREWLEAADRALYQAKRAGRNRSAGRSAQAGDPPAGAGEGAPRS